jgi:hypothetical protein
MNLEIVVRDRKIFLKLEEGNEIIDKLGWEDENNLSLSLLKNFDKILTRNKIKTMDLEKSEVKIKKAGLTTSRIIETVSKTLNFCLTK